jgi:hypothetical protein
MEVQLDSKHTDKFPVLCDIGCLSEWYERLAVCIEQLSSSTQLPDAEKTCRRSFLD